MECTTIRELYKNTDAYVGRKVTVGGWVRSNRDSKAFGFLVLSEEAEFVYKVTDFYHPGDEAGLAWNDPQIGIDWPQVTGTYKGTADSAGYTLTDGTPLNLSDRDKVWGGLAGLR